MKHAPCAIVISVLLVWVYELRQDHDGLVAHNREMAYAFDQIDSIAMEYRRKLYQVRMSCGRDI